MAAQSAEKLALDRSSVRTYDQDGRLRVSVANLSKSNVCPYLGSEIPDNEALGLDPKKVYQLLRDPEELAKAVPTFNGVPLLNTHVPSTAWDHPAGKVVGATGTDAVFEAPYLKNSLIVWTADAIQGIESGEQQELSCGYRYRAEMTPGSHEGVNFDGRMVEILGNHVALVAAGRAGSDVIVGDSQIEKETGMTKVKALSRRAAMARGALMVALKPTMLAKDAKLDYGAMLQGVTVANWKESKAKIIAAIKPKIAADADVQELVNLLDMLDGETDGADDEPPAVAAPAVDADPLEEVLAMLKGKVSDEELAAIGEKLKALKPAPAVDADPAAKKPDADPADNKDMVSKSAMDAALKAASDKASKDIKAAADSAEKNTMARLRSIREAEDATTPYVGRLTGAFDSAEAVYRSALDSMGVKHDGIHESALRAVLEAHPKPGETRRQMAQDARPEGFATRFPALAAVRVI
jgi:uncharacterized protein